MSTETKGQLPHPLSTTAAGLFLARNSDLLEPQAPRHARPRTRPERNKRRVRYPTHLVQGSSTGGGQNSVFSPNSRMVGATRFFAYAFASQRQTLVFLTRVRRTDIPNLFEARRTGDRYSAPSGSIMGRAPTMGTPGSIAWKPRFTLPANADAGAHETVAGDRAHDRDRTPDGHRAARSDAPRVIDSGRAYRGIRFRNRGRQQHGRNDGGENASHHLLLFEFVQAYGLLIALWR
jgi:hypothetical protein